MAFYFLDDPLDSVFILAFFEKLIGEGARDDQIFNVFTRCDHGLIELLAINSSVVQPTKVKTKHQCESTKHQTSEKVSSFQP